MLKTGAICPRIQPEPITVISGLGVALERNGKKRLILDARYINLFDKYEGFSDDSLSDVPHYLQSNYFIMLTDPEAGYHQVKIASCKIKMAHSSVLEESPNLRILRMHHAI